MKLRILMVAVVMAVLFFITGILYAANGDLIVNGNLGVGTTTPTGKAEVNGNMVVDGNSTVKGNTIVNGNLGVGTTTPQEKLDVNGNISVVIDGKQYKLGTANSGDTYGSGSLSSNIQDTCDKNYTSQYSCSPDDSKTCNDVWYQGGLSYHRTVTCKRQLVFIEQ